MRPYHLYVTIHLLIQFASNDDHHRPSLCNSHSWHSKTHIFYLWLVIYFIHCVIASFDGYMSYHTTLQDFVMQCDDAVNSLYYEEAQADFETTNSPPTYIMSSPMENCIPLYQVNIQEIPSWTIWKFWLCCT